MKRLVIKRLDLDLRGVAPASAEAALGLLSPALARALAHRQVAATAQDRLDAGRIALPAAPSARVLATQVTRRIAEHTSKG